MGLFDGLSRTDYQDVLRAVGQLADAHGWRGLRLVERGDGLLLQARAPGEPRDGVVTMLLAEERVLELLRAAYAHRGGGAPGGARREPEPVAHGGPAGVGYQQALRAVGGLLDRRGLHHPRLVDWRAGLLLQATARDDPRREPVTVLLTADELRALVGGR